MRGWIKLQKKLKDDPLLWRMARALGEREGNPPVPFQRLLATCVGAVCILWITGDSHIDEQDIMALGPADIDQLTGIEGVCELLPTEWLQVIDPHHVKLPGFHTHNGTKAIKNAQAQERMQRHRSTKSERVRNKSVTRALRSA